MAYKGIAAKTLSDGSKHIYVRLECPLQTRQLSIQ